MKKALSLILVMALAVICAVPAASESNVGTKNSVGMSVLGFSSVDVVTGQTVTSDIIDDVTLTVINEWASWCGPCMNEMPHFQTAHEYYSATPEADVQIIGSIYDTSMSTAANLLNSNGYTWINVMEDTVLAEIFNTEGYIPQTIIVDRSGVVRDHRVASFSSYNELKNYIDGWLEILAAEEEPQFLPGDMDLNGVLTSSDALTILRMAMGLLEGDEAVADYDGDGSVTSLDAIGVLRAAL